MKTDLEYELLVEELAHVKSQRDGWHTRALKAEARASVLAEQNEELAQFRSEAFYRTREMGQA